MSPILSLSFYPLPSLLLTTKTLDIWRGRQQTILNVKLWQTLLVAYSMSTLPSFLPIRTTVLLGAANFLTKGDNFPGSLVPGMLMWINSNQWGIRGSPLGRISRSFAFLMEKGQIQLAHIFCHLPFLSFYWSLGMISEGAGECCTCED